MDARKLLNARDLEEYEARSDALLMAHHDEAMDCIAFESLLGFGLYLFDEARRLAERLNTVIRGEGEVRLPQVEEIDDRWEVTGAVTVDTSAKAAEIVSGVFKWWLAPRDKVLRAIEHFERLGYCLDRADDFRQACRDAAVAAEWDRTQRAVEEMEHGGGIPLDDLRRDLGL